MKTIINILAIIFIPVIYKIFSWGLVCFKFWGWFITPIFHDLPNINFLQAAGIIFFIDLFKQNYNSDFSKKLNDEDNFETIISFLYPWIILFWGWIFYSFTKLF